MTASIVKTGLTPARPAGRRARGVRRVVENDDYAGFARRIVAAHGRRIASGDVEGLAALALVAADVDTALRDAVSGCRAAGFSWAEIATRLGTTRQAAQQRFGKG